MIGLNGWQRGNVGCLFLSTAAAVLIKEVQRCWEGRSASVHCSVVWSSVVLLRRRCDGYWSDSERMLQVMLVLLEAGLVSD